MTAMTKTPEGVDHFQASRAIYDELEALMADPKSMELSHSELEDLLLEGYDRIVRQLYQDFLAMTEKRETEQTAEACVSEDEGGKVVNDSNPDLSHPDSPSEAGPHEELLTADPKGIAMGIDTPCLGTAQTAHRYAGVSVELCECGKRIAGLYADCDDIPIVLIPQNILTTSDNTVGRNKLVHVDDKPVVVKGITTVVFPNVPEPPSPAYPMELPHHPRPVWCRVRITNAIIPRAA